MLGGESSKGLPWVTLVLEFLSAFKVPCTCFSVCACPSSADAVNLLLDTAPGGDPAAQQLAQQQQRQQQQQSAAVAAGAAADGQQQQQQVRCGDQEPQLPG